jgi:hypothetical protein
MSYLVATTALPANTGILVAAEPGHADATWDHKNRIILYSILSSPQKSGALELRKQRNLDYTAHDVFLS